MQRLQPGEIEVAAVDDKDRARRPVNQVEHIEGHLAGRHMDENGNGAAQVDDGVGFDCRLGRAEVVAPGRRRLLQRFHDSVLPFLHEPEFDFLAACQFVKQHAVLGLEGQGLTANCVGHNRLFNEGSEDPRHPNAVSKLGLAAAEAAVIGEEVRAGAVVAHFGTEHHDAPRIDHKLRVPGQRIAT